MKITCMNDSIETRCTGCYCHTLDVRFGQDKDTCKECGCPKTIEGFRKWKEEHAK